MEGKKGWRKGGYKTPGVKTDLHLLLIEVIPQNIRKTYKLYGTHAESNLNSTLQIPIEHFKLKLTLQNLTEPNRTLILLSEHGKSYQL